jgi:hypothetical protein
MPRLRRPKDAAARKRSWVNGQLESDTDPALLGTTIVPLA